MTTPPPGIVPGLIPPTRQPARFRGRPHTDCRASEHTRLAPVSARSGYVRVVTVCTLGHEHERAVLCHGYVPDEVLASEPRWWVDRDPLGACLSPDDLAVRAQEQLRDHPNDCIRRGFVLLF